LVRVEVEDVFDHLGEDGHQDHQQRDDAANDRSLVPPEPRPGDIPRRATLDRFLRIRVGFEREGELGISFDISGGGCYRAELPPFCVCERLGRMNWCAPSSTPMSTAVTHRCSPISLPPTWRHDRCTAKPGGLPDWDAITTAGVGVPTVM